MIRVSNSLEPDQAQQNIGLVWIQTVCKSYQQRALGCNELIVIYSM